MNLRNVTQPELVMLGTEFTCKEDCIAALASRLAAAGRIESADAFCRAVKEREALASTYSAMSVAMPHGISETVRQASVCFLRNRFPFDWDGDGETPVHLIFLLAVAKGKNTGEENEQLALLSAICVMLLDDELRERLDTAKTQEEAIQIITDYGA